jgi:hypothetical protein
MEHPICPLIKGPCLLRGCAMIRDRKGYSHKEIQEKKLYYCGLSGLPNSEVGIIDISIEEIIERK